MKFFMTLFLLGLPGVARASRLDARLDVRQDVPSGNSSAILPTQSLSSSKESAAPSLVATSSGVTAPSSTPKQERGPQNSDSEGLPGGSPPEPVPAIVTSPVVTPTLGESPVTPTAPIPTDAGTDTNTTTLAFSLSNIAALAETSLAGHTTIATTNSFSVGESSPTTLATSKTTPSVLASTPGEKSGFITITSNSDTISSPTETATMSNPSPTPNNVSSSDSSGGTSTLTIVLSTVLSVTGVILIAVAAYLCTGGRRKRLPMFKRGITPIGDDEIATWKSNRSAEKVDRYTTRPSHSQNASTATSTRRAPSLIQYQNGARPSLEVASPRSFIGGGKHSFDLPQAPGAVLARAPNARSGLTDDIIPGDDPFLPSPKRHPSRLHKLPPNSPSLHGRTKGSRSSSLRSFAEAAWRLGDAQETSSPRGSSDAYSRNHNRIYSSSSIPPPPRLSFGDSEQLTGLSPPPSRRNDSTIGLAVG
ncbi:hypothetical protein GGR54DRAFT_338494 [Hypoxylon sp. NC1633]|nr:hypothetical protein GGR54DRAFT_338494 [Hypoxylon sp. NC1633]